MSRNRYHRFQPGDYVTCTTDRWSTVHKGRTFKVESSHFTNGKEYIVVNHPKFGRSSYRAEYFQRCDAAWCPSSNRRTFTVQAAEFKIGIDPGIEISAPIENKEKQQMYIAVNLRQDKLEEIMPHELFGASRIIGSDTSFDRLKPTIKQFVERFPEGKVAVFSLHTIAEVNAPPVIFRNMRA